MDEFHVLLNEDESEERGDRMASFLMRFSPKASLDIGCSSGFLVRALRGRGVESFGIDVDESRFLECVCDALFVADAGNEAFPFEDSCFDMVTANTSLDYVPNYRHALDETCRVLKRGGWLIVSFATDPRMKFEARPNVFSTREWIGELSTRGFTCNEKLASDYLWHLGTKPEIANSLLEYVPRSILSLWMMTRGSSFGCVIANYDMPTSKKHRNSSILEDEPTPSAKSLEGAVRGRAAAQ